MGLCKILNFESFPFIRRIIVSVSFTVVSSLVVRVSGGLDQEKRCIVFVSPNSTRNLIVHNPSLRNPPPVRSFPLPYLDKPLVTHPGPTSDLHSRLGLPRDVESIPYP